MKMKSVLLAALVAFSSAFAFAGKDDPATSGFAILPVKGSEVFKVVYKGQNAGRVKVNVYSENGTQIHSQTISGVDGFIVPLNFHGLTSGTYTVEVVDKTGKKVERIVYAPASGIQHLHAVKLANDDSRFLVSVSHKGTSNLAVKIYDAEKKLIHSEVSEVTGDFARVYKLAPGATGVIFEVTDGEGRVKTTRL